MSHVVGLHKKYVKGTPKKAIVKEVQSLLCHLPASVIKGAGLPFKKVYINTRVIKHNYDKRPAQDYDLLIGNLHNIVKYPSKIYKNKEEKRGSLVFVKTVNNEECLCVVETSQADDLSEVVCLVATFYVPGEGYLDGFGLLWEWKDGNPSS